MTRTRRAFSTAALTALLAVGGATVATSGGASVAAAQAEVPGEVMIILASSILPGPIDPRLANVAALRRAPFDSYTSMALLSSPRVRLVVGEPQEVRLPNGRRIRIVLREVTENGRYRLRVSINRPGQQDYLPEMSVVTSPGDPFFIAGQSFQEGTLVIGIRLGNRRTP